MLIITARPEYGGPNYDEGVVEGPCVQVVEVGCQENGKVAEGKNGGEWGRMGGIGVGGWGEYQDGGNWLRPLPSRLGGGSSLEFLHG